jgi:hypothetical protein
MTNCVGIAALSRMPDQSTAQAKQPTATIVESNRNTKQAVCSSRGTACGSGAGVQEKAHHWAARSRERRLATVAVRCGFARRCDWGASRGLVGDLRELDLRIRISNRWLGMQHTSHTHDGLPQPKSLDLKVVSW